MKQVISAWVTAELAHKLSEMAQERGISVSTLATRALGSFAGVEIPEPKNGWDHRDARALAILRGHPEYSLREMTERLAQAGIKRSKDWVREKRSTQDDSCLESL